MNENYLMLNGKRVDLTDEQIEKLGLKIEKKDCFTRVNREDKYFIIDVIGTVCSTQDFYWKSDAERYNTANYCTDKSLMQQRALHETLSRLLWRFSIQNDGDKITWKTNPAGRTEKHFVYYNHFNETFEISNYEIYDVQGVVYFYSKEIAQRAIDEIVLPFMKEHPDFVW